MLVATVLLLGIIGIGGLSVLLYLYNWLYNNPHRNMIIMVGVAIILNLMIFTFCVISYSHIKIAVGPQGPQGPSGANGYIGMDGPQGPQGPTGPVAGSNTQIIFNDGGSSGADANLTYNKATSTLTSNTIVAANNTAYANSTGTVKVIQFYNQTTSTLDTVFL